MCAEFEHYIWKKNPKKQNQTSGRHEDKNGRNGRMNSRLLVIFWLGQNKSENQSLHSSVFRKIH